MPPQAKETTSRADTERTERITQRSRNEHWKKQPRRIESSECIGCDTCVRSCPPEFGAIFDRGLDVVIIPELCSGCPMCVMVCPVDCIYDDEEWTPTDAQLWNHIALTGKGASA
jgi:electron transport complex protein RnfB